MPLLTGRIGTADSIPGFIVPGVGPAPTVETLPAAHISATRATLRGTINPNELATEYHFEYWEGEERPAEPSRAPAEDIDAGAGTNLILVSQAVTGLKRATTYGCRLVASNSAGEGIGADAPFFTRPSRVAVTHEYTPDKLSVRIVNPDGSPARWAEDESNVENVITGLSYGSEMPGGYKELSGNLARNPRRDYPDLAIYSDIYVEGPGSDRRWEGRLDKRPESDGDHMAIEPKAVGWQAALLDRPGRIGPGFIHSDLSAWGDISLQRKVNLGENQRFDGAMSTGLRGTGETPPGITLDFKGVTTEKGKTDRGDATFYGGGALLGAILYHYARYSGPTTAAWHTFARMSADAEITASVVEGVNHEGATNANAFERLDADGGCKYAHVSSLRGEEGEGGAELIELDNWENVRILGDQGLTLQGTWPTVGFTAKQMLEWAINELTVLVATDASLEDDGFVIPHAWFADSGDMGEIVKELTKYGLYDWFVFDDRLFQLRQPGTYGRTWQATTSQSELREQGEDGERLWRSIMVRYQDVDGTTRTVGPPGSGANVESAALEITDPDHPAVKAELPRDDVLDLSGVSEESFALRVGERWLEEANELSRSGGATLKGYVMDDRSAFRPVSQIKAGDYFRPTDASDPSPRKIVQANYDHDQRTCQVTLDAPRNSVEALLERYRAALIPMGIG